MPLNLLKRRDCSAWITRYAKPGKMLSECQSCNLRAHSCDSNPMSANSAIIWEQSSGSIIMLHIRTIVSIREDKCLEEICTQCPSGNIYASRGIRAGWGNQLENLLHDVTEQPARGGVHDQACIRWALSTGGRNNLSRGGQAAA